MRRAKIVCTMGPAVDSEQKVKELIDAGMNMARMNLSHGTYAEHQLRFNQVRAGAKAAGRPIAILVDLQGPKIRLARFIAGPHELARGDIFTITTDEVDGTRDRVGTTYKGLPGDCKVGDHILIDDGKVTVQVTQVSGNDVITTVIEAGMVSNNKGINLPGVAVSVPAMSEKDIEDLRWGLRAGADFIALSFVRDAADIKDVHTIMDEEGIRIPVIAKIEKPQAVANINEIIEAFDGIMVARGDLGVELPIEDVPLVQKLCVELARDMAKPVIVATQMLDSMITNSRPTRAEATDCANAVLDGADALMLSGETSVGEFAIESVLTMARIIQKTEEGGLDRIRPIKTAPRSKGGAITKAATEVGAIVGAKYLVAFTQSGDSARRMSRMRSPIPILAMTPEIGTFNRLALSWGVESMLTPIVGATDEMVKLVDSVLIDSKRAHIGDNVMIVAGSPPGIPGSTNAMRVHRVGDAVGGAAPAYR
ncbi:MAG: pyruvate kinase [Candidatus Planktophila sp.]|nr:pyruvate kinase [Candidatus Planktophila sp.]PHX75174.1 MAG: pyruvate kinase [Actinomycetota bacterium]